MGFLFGGEVTGYRCMWYKSAAHEREIVAPDCPSFPRILSSCIESKRVAGECGFAEV